MSLVAYDAGGEAVVLTSDELALSRAAGLGELARCRELLEAGVNPNAHLPGSTAPLHLAAFGGHYEVVELLVEWGAKVSETALKGWDVMRYAVVSQDLRMCQLLHARGARVDVVANDWTCSLHTAIANDSSALVGWLLEQGANPFRMPAKKVAGYVSPLQLAVKRRRNSIIERFAQYGDIDFDQRTFSGKSLWDLTGDASSTRQLLRALQVAQAIRANMEDGGSACSVSRRDELTALDVDSGDTARAGGPSAGLL